MKFLQKTLFFTVFSCLISPSFASNYNKLPLAQQQFADTMVQQYHYNKQAVVEILSRIQYRKKVLTSITHPAEKKSWDWYQRFFISNKRISAGVNYWRDHRQALEKAEHRYGINPSILIAIAGVESFYGQREGSYLALNSLGTLAFDYPKREKFFQKELANYILLTHEQHLSPYTLKSSYAGALGIPQFMPSSYRHYAISSNNKNANLFSNHKDALYSIANYLKVHGWENHQPIVIPTTARAPIAKKLLSRTAAHSIQWYAQKGIYPIHKNQSNRSAGLIKLNTQKHTPYWFAYPNFYAIYAYNHSVNYAMVIVQLAKKIQHRYYHG